MGRMKLQRQVIFPFLNAQNPACPLSYLMSILIISPGVSVSRFAERQVDAMVAHYSVMTFLERQYAVVAQSSGSAPDNHSHFASWKMMPSV